MTDLDGSATISRRAAWRLWEAKNALKELAAISPSTPIVGSSGYSGALAMRRFGIKGSLRFCRAFYYPQALSES